MIPLFKVAMDPRAAADVAMVLASGYIGEGPVAERFEKNFNYYCPKEDFVLMNSCTSSIHAVLMHLGIGPGDEVITTPMTCIATNAPIVAVGATPVFADVEPLTGNIDVNSVARKITTKTKAIIAVNWTGRPADYKALRKYGRPVIEDAAHGPLVSHPETGDFICYSFGPIKHLTSGDGGGVGCSRTAADDLRLRRWYGLDRTSSKDFRCEQDIGMLGLKFHMNDINASIGMANLGTLVDKVEVHKGNAADLYAGLHGCKKIELANWDPYSNYWVFPILCKNEKKRDQLQQVLKAHKIQASQVHARNDRHTYYWQFDELPGVDSFVNRQLNIPCGWWISQSDIDYITETIKRVA